MIHKSDPPQGTQSAAQLFPPDVLERLSHAQTITDSPPWCWQSDRKVVEHYGKLCAQVSKQLSLQHELYSNHHGSGYASYVSALFYTTPPIWKQSPSNPARRSDAALNITFSRLSPYFIVDEREHLMPAEGCYTSAPMPKLNKLDTLHDSRIKALVPDVQRLLEAQGLERLYKNVLGQVLPQSALQADSMLMLLEGRREHTYFDALFHWND